MKLIIALIQPTKLEAVKEALSRVEVFRLTVMDVQGFGRQKGYTEVYRGHEVTVNLHLRKIELQIAVNEDFVEPTINAILEAGRSGPDGKIGDGKIFILPLDDCIRIRTGERGTGGDLISSVWPVARKRLSGKRFAGWVQQWVQPTNFPEKAVGFTHPTIVKQAFPDSLQCVSFVPGQSLAPATARAA